MCLIYKQWISLIIVFVIVVMSSEPSTENFINNDSKETNFDNKFFSSKRIMLVSDTHWGGIEHNGCAADDIQDFIECTRYLNPDYIFHLGDITESGQDKEFLCAKENFSKIVKITNANGVWTIGGGSHDGLAGYIPLEDYFDSVPSLKRILNTLKSTKAGEKIYNMFDYLTQWLRVKFYMGFYQILNQTSQWYTLKIGNNIFVMVGYFYQPWTWSSGNYGGGGEANILNLNKVNWLNRTLAKWNGTGNNIFICHHFPLHHTNIYTHDWAGMKNKRFIYESKLIMDVLSLYTDVVAWFSGHVHTDSNATYSDHPNVSSGTIVSGLSRPDLPDHVHFIYCGNIWREHGSAWDIGKSSFSNLRYIDLIEGQSYVDIYAWDSTNNRSATMTVNDSENEVEKYRIPLPYLVSNLEEPLKYEQAWDVYDYCRLRYPWYQDDEGLRCDCNSWIESRWDFWEVKDFSNAMLYVDSSNPDALNHRIYYSLDCMKTWSGEWFTPSNLTTMPPARWIKIITNVSTTTELFIRDISFIFQ